MYYGATWSDRHCAGVVPDHRLNERINVLGSVDGVNYYYCSGNFYRSVFQGNNLVYVTAKP